LFYHSFINSMRPDLNPKGVVNLNRIAWSVWSGLPGQFQPDFTIKTISEKKIKNFGKQKKTRDNRTRGRRSEIK
ncbi:MAG: hypothetical protein WBP08_08055, partial [Saprospiraceae bacterium]